MREYRLRIASDEDFTRPVADFIDMLSRQGGLTSRQAYRLRLAVDEITTNIVQHGYADGRGVIDLEGGVDDERVWVRIEDDAPGFDPREHDPRPRLAAGAAGAAGQNEGGFGLFLALGNVDEFGYDYVRGRNRNTLIIERVASGAAPSEAEGETDARDESVGRR